VCSELRSLGPLLTQLRLQRNVLSEVEGAGRSAGSVIERAPERKERCVCSLRTRHDVLHNFVICNLGFCSSFVFHTCWSSESRQNFPPRSHPHSIRCRGEQRRHRHPGVHVPQAVSTQCVNYWYWCWFERSM